jgi:hypothetical protein
MEIKHLVLLYRYKYSKVFSSFIFAHHISTKMLLCMHVLNDVYRTVSTHVIHDYLFICYPNSILNVAITCMTQSPACDVVAVGFASGNNICIPYTSLNLPSSLLHLTIILSSLPQLLYSDYTLTYFIFLFCIS